MKNSGRDIINKISMQKTKNNPATCRYSTLEMPYCRPGEEDSLPPIWRNSLPRKRKVYPYALKELTGRDFENTLFHSVELENDFLKLIFLPELGGRMISLYDKRRSHELLFRNPVLKPVMAGLTGAWCGIGMEFNFPGSHSVTSDRPVSCCLETNANEGSATVCICDQEMVSGMRWQVNVTLKADSEAVFIRSICCNRTPLPRSGYWWTNAKVPAFQDTELVFPEAKGIGVIHPPVDITRIAELHLPYVKKNDISHYRDVYFQLPLFFHNLRRSSFGVYHREKGYGILHNANPGELPGRKIWTLGTGDDGKVVNENLTLDGAGNIEIQAGPLPIQTDFMRMNPGETRIWDETWLPISDMLATHQASNADFTVSSEAGGRLRIQCHSSLPAVQFHNAGRTREFMPEAGTIVDVESQGGAWSITDAQGWILLEAYPDGQTSSKETEAAEKIDLQTAEAQYLKGLYLEEDGRGAEAVAFYRAALEIDSTYSPALAALGARELLLDRPAEARALFEKALWKNRRNPEYSYYLGLACLRLGEDCEAEFQLKRACCSPAWQAAASARLAELYFRRRRSSELEKLLASPGLQSNVELLETAAFYAYTRGRDLDEILEKLRKCAPENPLPNLLLGKHDFPETVDHRKILVAVERLFVHGLDKLAREIAARYQEIDPIAAYMCGNIELAERHTLAGVFPPPELAYRMECLSRQFGDAPACKYYCGVLRAAREDWEGAAAAWNDAWQMGLREPELCRNLGIYHWLVAENPAKAAEYYAAGFQPGKINYKYVCEYDQLLEQLGDMETRRKVLPSLPQRLSENAYVLLRIATLKYADGDLEGTLEMLKGRRFVLCEGKRMTGALFISANHKLGDMAMAAGEPEKALAFYEAAMSYPHNLGVGRSNGRFDMKTKYLILSALVAAGRHAEAEERRESWLRECDELDIDFYTLASIRWECGVPSHSPLLEENEHFYHLIWKL